MVRCQPGIVSFIQSKRLTAVGARVEAGKAVASFNQVSEISKALSTTDTSFVPRGFKPWALTNLRAVSRAVASGKTSSLPVPLFPACENNVVKGLTKPTGLIPSCSNCAFICSCI